MPKIPDYDSRITPVVGGVQPGRDYLPNIHMDTGTPAMFAAVGVAGQQLEKTGIQGIARATRQQQTIDMANALGAYYKGAADTEVELSRVFDPNIGEIAKQKLADLRDGVVSTVPELMRPVLAAKLDQLGAHSYKTVIDQYQVRQQHLGVETGKQSLDDITNTIIAAENDQGNPGKLAAAWGSAKGLAASLEQSGIYPPGQAQKMVQDQVFAKRFGHDMLTNPQETLKILQEPAQALQKYNLNEKVLPAAITHVTEQLHKQQTDFYNKQFTNVLNVQAGQQGQVPNGQQIAQWAVEGKISGTQGKTLSAFANGDESIQNDPMTQMRIRDDILYKKAPEEVIRESIWQAVRNKQLKPSTGSSELTNLHNINMKEEPPEKAAYKNLVSGFRGVLGGNNLMGFDKAENAMKFWQGQTALDNQMEKDRKAGTPWTAKDIQEKGPDILRQYGFSVDAMKLPGGTKPPSSGPPIANPKTVEELMTLPAAQYKGKTWQDGRGGIYRSDGTGWPRIN